MRRWLCISMTSLFLSAALFFILTLQLICHKTLHCIYIRKGDCYNIGITYDKELVTSHQEN